MKTKIKIKSKEEILDSLLKLNAVRYDHGYGIVTKHDFPISFNNDMFKLCDKETDIEEYQVYENKKTGVIQITEGYLLHPDWYDEIRSDFTFNDLLKLRNEWWVNLNTIAKIEYFNTKTKEIKISGVWASVNQFNEIFNLYKEGN